MTKNEFCKRITEETIGEFNQKEIADVLDAIEKVVKDVVLKEDEVTLPGICKVSVKVVPERRGKILLGDRKGEEYVVPEHKEPKLKLVKSFKEILL